MAKTYRCIWHMGNKCITVSQSGSRAHDQGHMTKNQPITVPVFCWVKVQVCNKSYCIPSGLVSHCVFLFHYTRWWNRDFIWSWWYYHKYWTNWWWMVERCCSQWLCWIISSELCGNYLLKEMTPSWSFSTRFWFNEIIDC